MSIRFIFAGTPPFAAELLEALCLHGFTPSLVLTPPDKPAHRGLKLQASAVKKIALQYHLPILQPEKLNSQNLLKKLNELSLDLGIVVAYGALIPSKLLHLPQAGWVNVHPSSLPKWRGAAPIHRSLLSMESETGVSLMQLDPGLDTGPVYAQQICPISPEESVESLTQKLAHLSKKMLLQFLHQMKSGNLPASKEQSKKGVCYAEKLTKYEALIDFNKPTDYLFRHIKVFQKPAPTAFFFLNQTTKINVLHAIAEGALEEEPGKILAWDAEGLRISTKDGVLRITKLQLPNRPAVSAHDLKNGHKNLFMPGEIIKS